MFIRCYPNVGLLMDVLIAPDTLKFTFSINEYFSGLSGLNIFSSISAVTKLWANAENSIKYFALVSQYTHYWTSFTVLLSYRCCIIEIDFYIQISLLRRLGRCPIAWLVLWAHILAGCPSGRQTYDTVVFEPTPPVWKASAPSTTAGQTQRCCIIGFWFDVLRSKDIVCLQPAQVNWSWWCRNGNPGHSNLILKTCHCSHLYRRQVRGEAAPGGGTSAAGASVKWARGAGPGHPGAGRRHPQGRPPARPTQ